MKLFNNVKDFVEAHLEKFLIALIVICCLCLLALCSPQKADAQEVPAAAYTWKQPVTQAVQSVYGLNGPVARIAALVQVESNWDPQAKSIYAQGLTQFTPGTANWIATVYPELQPADPWNPRWSLLAASIYTQRLLSGIQPFEHALSNCDAWAFTLCAYNGGATWLNRDRTLTQSVGDDPDAWFGSTENHSRRAKWAFAENRAYPVKILKTWEPRYIAAGWPGSAACGESL